MRVARGERSLGGGHRRAPGARRARLRARRPGRGGRLTPLSADPFDLGRFHAAQSGGVHEDALAQLRAGHKTGHWMWFVFPQLAGLGLSPTARHYAVSGLPEARAYLADPLLGERLRENAEALLSLPADTSAVAVLGDVDAMKLRSSMTLFDAAADPARDAVLAAVLRRFHGGAPDPRTLELLAVTPS